LAKQSGNAWLGKPKFEPGFTELAKIDFASPFYKMRFFRRSGDQEGAEECGGRSMRMSLAQCGHTPRAHIKLNDKSWNLGTSSLASASIPRVECFARTVCD